MSSSLPPPLSSHTHHLPNNKSQWMKYNLNNAIRPHKIESDILWLLKKRLVTKILSSNVFIEHLESVLQGHIDGTSSKVQAIRRLQAGVISANTLESTHRHALSSMTSKKDHDIMVTSLLHHRPFIAPINDIPDDCPYSREERHERCKLASLYRLVDRMGWSQLIFNHISLRAPGDDEHFLLNPFGLHYSEVTASNLVKVDLEGKLIDPGTTQLGISKAGYTIHSAIHAVRPDIKCIIHVHTPAGAAVSAMKCGLLPLCQEAMIFGGVSYHSYNGIVVDETEKESLVADLGPVNRVMILRNHGLLAMGRTVEESFVICYNLLKACETQVMAFSIGINNIIQVNDDIARKVMSIALSSGGGVSCHDNFGVGELEYEAMMRTLDNLGYNTGYPYKANQLLSQENIDTDSKVKFKKEYSHEKLPSSNKHSFVPVSLIGNSVGMSDTKTPPFPPPLSSSLHPSSFPPSLSSSPFPSSSFPPSLPSSSFPSSFPPSLPPSLPSSLPPSFFPSSSLPLGSSFPSSYPPFTSTVMQNSTSLQASMGTNLPPSMGTNLPPSMGTILPPSMGTSPPPSMGTNLPPSMGTSPPPSMGTNLPPSMGTSPPPSMGTSPPPSMGTNLPPSMGTSPPPSMGTSLPPSMGTSPPPSMGTSPPPSMGTSLPPSMGTSPSSQTSTNNWTFLDKRIADSSPIGFRKSAVSPPPNITQPQPLSHPLSTSKLYTPNSEHVPTYNLPTSQPVSRPTYTSHQPIITTPQPVTSTPIYTPLTSQPVTNIPIYKSNHPIMSMPMYTLPTSQPVTSTPMYPLPTSQPIASTPIYTPPTSQPTSVPQPVLTSGKRTHQERVQFNPTIMTYNNNNSPPTPLKLPSLPSSSSSNSSISSIEDKVAHHKNELRKLHSSKKSHSTTSSSSSSSNTSLHKPITRPLVQESAVISKGRERHTIQAPISSNSPSVQAALTGDSSLREESREIVIDELSGLEKVVRTAEEVAESTGQSVEKLSKSLSLHNSDII